MWRGFTSSAVLELSRSHTALSRVDVWHGGRPVYTLDVSGGSVEAEAGRPVFRNFSGTLVDPTGALSGGDVDDLLNPYDCELAPWRGVRTPAGDEYAPLGVFGLTGRLVDGDGSIRVTGQDRAMGYQGPMTGSLAIGSGTPVEAAIARLLATRQPGVTFAENWVTGFTVGPLLFEADIDVWAEAQTLARSVGGWLHHDRQGGLVFSSVLPETRTPVARYAAGEGTGLVRLSRQEDSDTIRNIVVVESTKTATGSIIRAEAADDDPFSPTYFRGRYGRRPKTITNQHVGSLAQAQQMAATELVRELGRSETGSLTVVADPRLDPLDVVAVHRPAAGLTDRGMVIASLETPLGVEDAMSIGLQRSILAQSGAVLEVPLAGVA